MSNTSAKNAKPPRGQVASREKRTHPVNLGEHIPGLLNHDGAAVDEAIVIVNSVRQQESACAAAHSHVERTAPATEKARAAYLDDIDVVANAKMIEVLHQAIRIKGDEKYSLFPSPEWMRDGLTGIAIGILANIYAECQRAEEPRTWPEIGRDTVEDIMALCVEHFGDEVPELVLSSHAREWLTQWMVMASYWLDRERRAAAALVAAAGGLIESAERGDAADIWHSNAAAYLGDLPEFIRERARIDVEDDGEDDPT